MMERRRTILDRIPWSDLRFWALAFIALNVGWRITRYAVGFPMWGDEAYLTISIVTRTPAELMKPLEYNQIAPIGFLWLEWLVGRVLGASEYALRLAPFLAGLASPFLFWRLVDRALPKRLAVLAIGFFAASYYPVRHAAEIKPYSIDLLVALIILNLAWTTLQARGGARNWVALTAVMVAAVWFSYPAAFVAGGAVLALGAIPIEKRSASSLVPWLLSGALLAASFATMYSLVGSGQRATGAELTESGHWEFTFPPLEEPWLLPVWFFKVHTGNMFAYPIGGRDGGSTVTLLLFVVGAATLWRRGRRGLVLLLVAPLPLMFIAAALEKYPYGGSARVAQHMAPAICLLAGVGFVGAARWFLAPRACIHATRGLYLVLVAFIVAGAIRDVAEPYKKFTDLENRRIIRSLAGQTEPGDVWAIFGSPHTGSSDVPSWAGWGGSSARFRYLVRRFAPTEVVWGPPAETIEPPRDGSLWLVVYRDNRAPFPETMFDRYLETLRARLGRPDAHERHKLSDRDETIEVYRFDGDS